MAQFITAREAAKKIKDGATIAVAGMGLSGLAEEVIEAIRDEFRENGHPRDLALRHASAMGDWHERGVTVLGEAGPGLITKWTGGHIGSAFALNALAGKNELQCTCLPQGVIVNLWRESAAGRPGLITKVGLGTFVDPRNGGGKMNECTTEKLVELIEIGGEEYLFYPSFKLDVAIVRGTTADEHGNISFEHESVINEGLQVATAARRNGGIVIAQVEYIAKAETLHPKDVKIPGVMVDYVVVATDKKNCWQTEGKYFEPSFSGDIKKPLSAIEPLPFDERKIITRRCAMEFRTGDVVNLGVGLPADTAKVIAEEGYIDRVTMSTESGMVGGVPSALPDFGSAYNPECIVTPGDMFDMIDGGGFLDLTVLGIGEIDEKGNNNVSKMGNRNTGPGGFINITRSTGKVIFAGTLTGKAKFELGGGKIKIVSEGTIRKFVKQVGQITYSAEFKDPAQEVLYVTERGVFRLEDGGLTLIEIAPGITVEHDILPAMDFAPKISPDLKTMDAGIFNEKWGGLGKYIEG